MTTASLLRDRLLDLLLKGYTFADDLRAGSDDPRAGTRVRLRLLGDDALLVRGRAGVDLFYDTNRVRREGALPGVVRGGLFGEGSVHGLDDESHRHRKEMFIASSAAPGRLEALLADTSTEWEDTIRRRWLTDGSSASVYDTAVEVYGRSLLRWAGLDLPHGTATQIARDEAAIVDGFAVPGPAWVRMMIARRRCDDFFVEQVRAARAGALAPPPGSSFALVLEHRDLDGAPLDDRTAAVELQNAFRPGIAVARFAAFLALAMHRHPQWRERIYAETLERGTTSGGPLATAVAEEVRRFYPFVPLLPAVARQDLTVEDEHLAQGQRLLIDIYGTNRDERHWERPEQFDPTRFLDTDEAAADYFVPQGGGEVATGHRCPGEAVTVGLLAQTAAELSRLDARVARDGLDYSLRRMPTKPRNGVLLSEVTLRPSEVSGS